MDMFATEGRREREDTHTRQAECFVHLSSFQLSYLFCSCLFDFSLDTGGQKGKEMERMRARGGNGIGKDQERKT